MLRLLGAEGNQGAELGLSADFAYNIIKSVGNYGDIFERSRGGTGGPDGFDPLDRTRVATEWHPLPPPRPPFL